MQKASKRGAITRREALRRVAAGAAGLALGGPLGALAAPVRQPTARSVIQIWMWGGPSHLDTFDPKPGLGRDYCGPFDTAIPTNVEGIQVNAQLPRLAMQADKYSIIRSMTHGSNAHETASYLMQTGRQPGRLVYPSAGAVVSLFKGYRAGYRGSAPPYIVLTQPQGRFSEAGFLGSEYGPFATGGDPNRDPFEVEGIVAPGVSDERQLRRRELLHALDTLGQAAPSDPYFAELDRCEQEAYDMMFGEMKQIFDLSQETQETRERYGRNTFGQACLVARRLVEHGVPYVTINYEGWDTHKQHFGTLSWKQPQMDSGMATLLQDLSDRGLLESTIVWWGGEFGRTPKIDWEPPWNGGRGHYGQCFSVVVAGGGFKGGRVVGASNETGEEVAERPVYPRDLLASIYTLLGIDPEGPLPNPRGLDARVLPADEAGARSGGLLTEIM
ncbi:MAG: hypothetical protein AMK73_05250 [Planctomycetes bacterium SM23_32]|nr:MAG: hypothetical protein AMK73_05250 [Planctomycetes bacterium SM23_32]